MVSNAFIDGYMAAANGEFVKVYLYLLRLADSRDGEFSVSLLADKLNNTEKDVLRALGYWEKLGLLRLERRPEGTLAGVTVLEVPEEEQPEAEGRKAGMPETEPLEAEAWSDAAPAAGASEADREPAVSGTEKTVRILEARTGAAGTAQREMAVSCSADSLERLQEEDGFQEVVFAAERYLGRTLSARDVELFGYMRETLGFPNDLIEYLIEYCVDGGHRSYRYMEKVALGWHEDGIQTLRQAKEANRAYKAENKAVMRAFGISGRILTPEERKLLESWLKEDGMPLPVVVEACGRTMKAIHSPSFEYTDKIIKDWKKAGIATVEAAQAYYEKQKAERRRPEKTQRAAAPNRFHNFDQRDTDYDALLMQEEQKLYGTDKSTV